MIEGRGGDGGVMDLLTLLGFLPLGAGLAGAVTWLLMSYQREARAARQAAVAGEPDHLAGTDPEPAADPEEGKHRPEVADAVPVAELLARGGRPVRVSWPVRHAETDEVPTRRLPRVVDPPADQR
ncbi:hypothetical protein GCM10010174_56880 [Kutzneria viridogrisea]|uniref:Lipid-binding transport protein (Tim44 family) n=2 Tax=Kutzneria TaxID=43356 RepID=A0ABR6BL55_9PSEU|nr:hypothetical protein [Kutzneria albida]AHH95045.1 putative membrane protein [Kutzneria albida DSM 43870]MBA8927599.1 putative lipid-binding transport protein (Tim44 family) [Kutzneria viridogrisea]